MQEQADAAAAFPIGATVDLEQIGAGEVSVSVVTIDGPASRLAATAGRHRLHLPNLHPFSLSWLTPETVSTIIGLVTPVLVWAIPNKKVT